MGQNIFKKETEKKKKSCLIYLSGRFDAFDKAAEDQQPSQSQAQSQLPNDVTGFTDITRVVQHSIPTKRKEN